MIKKITTALTIVAMSVFFIGCASGTGPTYSSGSVGSVSVVKLGTVQNAQPVQIADSGVGTLGGAVVGGLIGSQIGKGRGRTAATVGGAVLGGVAGNQMNKSSGQQLTINFDTGETITTVLKYDKQNPFQFRPGDRVSVYMTNGKVTTIRLVR